MNATNLVNFHFLSLEGRSLSLQQCSSENDSVEDKVRQEGCQYLLPKSGNNSSLNEQCTWYHGGP